MGTALELLHCVNPESHKIASRAVASRQRRTRALNARMLAVVFVGLTGISTPWKISAPSTPAVVAAEPRSAEALPSMLPDVTQDPSRMLLIGAALIAIAAAVRRGDTDTESR